MADPVQEYKQFIDGLQFTDGLRGWPRALGLAGGGVTLERAREMAQDRQEK